jgi:sulfatase maturation enzyme AslB (radical SAM superfamily)
MANIILTNACNANCSFCFAQDLTQQSIDNIGLDDFDRRLRFIKRSGLSQIRLTGGEPTLHPQFPEIIKRIIATDLILILFSNGFIRKEVLCDLIKMSPHRLAILLNTNAFSSSYDLQCFQCEILSRLNERITLGYTIVQPVFDLEPYFRWIKDFGLQPKLRLGMAQPILWGNNHYISPKQYKQVAKSILSNAEKSYREGIRLEFDCGFVRCMFTDQEWQLLDNLGTATGSHCEPNLDINLDDKIYHCFSIRQFAAKLGETTTTKTAYDDIMIQRKSFRESGIYPQCIECEERISGRCCAGCLSITLLRFHNLKQYFLNNSF